MAEELQRPYKGLYMDSSHVDQPKATYSFALNAVSESLEGDNNKLSFEQSNEEILNTLPSNSTFLNATYIGKNSFCVFLVTPATSIISIVNLDRKTYKEVVNDPNLNFNLQHPIEAVYRLRRGCEKTVYFTDNYNVPRYFNLDNVSLFKTEGNWDVNKFSLVKTYSSIPKYKQIEILEGGALPAGSYNFAIQYLDGDLNPTEWLNVSDTIIVFHDNEKEISYESVRGSTNNKTSYQDFGPTNKRIQLILDNLDTSYLFYRVAIIEANSGTGQVSKIVYSQEISTKQKVYSYTGNNAVSVGTEEEIALFKIDVRKAATILQLENELILGDIQGLPVNLCKLQKVASKIKANLATREVWLNTTKLANNPKNPQIHHFSGLDELDSIGYMPGEIYSFAVVFVFKGGITSPAFHIPGKPPADTENNMSANNTLLNTTYTNNEICEGESDYWGKDYLGNDLENTSVRHHRFPTRRELSIKTGKNYNIKNKTINGDVIEYTLKISETPGGRNFDLSGAPTLINVTVVYSFEGQTTEYFTTFVFNTSVYDPNSVNIINQSIITSKQKPRYISNSFTYLDSGGGGIITESFDITPTIEEDLVPTGVVSKNTLTLSWTTLGSSTPITYELPYTVGGESRLARGTIDIGVDTSVVIATSAEDIAANPADIVEIDPSTNLPYDPPQAASTTYTLTPGTIDVPIEGQFDVSEIFGITFSNIDIPSKEEIGEEIIGYYIVQNKRDEENKTVLDTGLMLPIIDSGSKFEGVGMLSPDGENFTSTKINSSTDPDYTAGKMTPAIANKYALFHPENAFLGKEYSSAEIEYNCSYIMVEGEVKQNTDIQDAQPGTSYNSERHKKRERDTDGFTLQVLSRKFRADGVSSEFNAFGLGTTEGGVSGFTDFVSDVEKIDYLNSLYSFTKTEGVEQKEVFNLSSDNRFAVVSCNSNMPNVNTVVTGGVKAEPYIKNNFYKHIVTLKRNLEDPYANFRVLPYYKASKNIQGAEKTETTIFSGDSYISPATITSSIFSDVRNRQRAGKRGLFKVLLGIVLVAAAIVLAPVSGGASIVGLTALGTGTVATAVAITAIGLGVTLAATGLKVEKMREVYETLYEQGLKNVVHDYTTRKFFDPNPADDSIQWFSDVLENVYFESSINMNWRTGSSGQIPDFTNSPKSYSIDFHNDRLIDKLTILDPEKDAGRLYQGFCNAELYEINKDYLRREMQKPFFHLPLEYDCCTDCLEEFKNRFIWSQQSFQEELTDNYRSFLPLNYKDMQGESGQIKSLHTIRENFYIQTEDGFWSLPKNYQERVTDEIVSFIGTGERFAIPPRPLMDSISGNNAGTQHIRGSIKTPYGIVFVSENEKAIYLFDGNSLKPLHLQGISNWLKQNISLNMVNLFQEQSQLEYPLTDNPYSKYGTGYLLGYDPRKKRVLITKRDFIINNQEIKDAPDLYLNFVGDTAYYIPNLQEEIDDIPGQETYKWKIRDYSGSTVNLIRDNVRTVEGVEEYYIETTTLEASPIVLDTSNASWTLTYNFKKEQWESFISYQPNLYLTSGDDFYTYNNDFNSIWKHNIEGKFNSFYGTNHKTIVEFVQINSPETKILNSIKLYTEARKYDTAKEDYVLIKDKTYNKAVFYNSSQCSGELSLVVKTDEAETWFSDPNTLAAGEVYIERSERDWSINDIRDMRINYAEPIWIKDKAILDPLPFTDKVLNTSTLDFNKDWKEAESLRDKYLVVRLIFDNFDDINIFLNYSYLDDTTSNS